MHTLLVRHFPLIFTISVHWSLTHATHTAISFHPRLRNFGNWEEWKKKWHIWSNYGKHSQNKANKMGKHIVQSKNRFRKVMGLQWSLEKSNSENWFCVLFAMVEMSEHLEEMKRDVKGFEFNRSKMVECAFCSAGQCTVPNELSWGFAKGVCLSVHYVFWLRVFFFRHFRSQHFDTLMPMQCSKMNICRFIVFSCSSCWRYCCLVELSYEFARRLPNKIRLYSTQNREHSALCAICRRCSNINIRDISCLYYS